MASNYVLPEIQTSPYRQRALVSDKLRFYSTDAPNRASAGS
jgi:hypothetical protein